MYFWSIQNSEEVIEILKLRNLKVRSYTFSIFLRYTILCHVILFILVRGRTFDSEGGGAFLVETDYLFSPRARPKMYFR